MKKLFALLVLLFIPSFAFTQDDACPAGTVKGGGMATPDCNYKAGCYTPEQKAILDNEFAACTCVYRLVRFQNSRYQFIQSSRWETGECVVTRTYLKKVNTNSWVEIDEEQFFSVTCLTEDICGADGCKRKYPKPEWTHCK